MAHGERAARLVRQRLKEYWGRLTGRERTERRRGEHRLTKDPGQADSDRLTSRRGRSEETR